MEWCVCQDNSSGRLTIMTRIERERMIGALIDLCEPVPTWVINVFENEDDAIKYVSDMSRVNGIIDNL